MANSLITIIKALSEMDMFDMAPINDKGFLTIAFDLNIKTKKKQKEKLCSLLGGNTRAETGWDKASSLITVFGKKKNPMNRYIELDIRQIIKHGFEKKLVHQSINIIIAHYFNYLPKNIAPELEISQPDVSKHSKKVLKAYSADNFEKVFKYIFRKVHRHYYAENNTYQFPKVA